MEETKKKTVAEIIIDRFLKDVDEKGTMPWQRPYERYNAFNYFTLNTYRGINRLLLPFGEYVTKKQINEYNKENDEDFKFQKGIVWYPVVFFTVQEKEITREELSKVFPDCDFSKTRLLGTDGIWSYFIADGKAYKKRNVLKYFNVADRKHFMNSKGEVLPSRLDTGDVTLVLEEPKKVLNDYIEREGISVIYDSIDTPCYIPSLDKVELNPHVKSEDHWYSTAFHEIGHSSGHFSRLNRKGVNVPLDITKKEKENIYAVEECIAEIVSCLLCAECGIYDMKTSGSDAYDNNVAYVQGWKKRVQEWGKEFIYIVSQADKAFNFILGDTEDKNR
ncbi:zincin-like metallopeptidase domain-containing protein [Clostridium baratii]